MRRISKCLGVGLAATAASAFAVSTSASAEDGADFIIELGAGVMVQPAWEGSDELLFSPYPIIAPRYISIGRFTIGGGPTRAFTLRPDINIRGERDDDDDLAGLDDVDFTFEAGAAVSYRYGPVKAAAALRRGFGGHEGFVGEASIQAVLEPTERWTFSIGPEVTFADDEYMDTYFGVSNAEAARSRFTAFDAGAGIKSAGVIADTRYQWNDNWAVTAEASWHRLVGDAADSPVVDLAGEENQFTAGIGVAYRFRFDLFN